MKIFEKPKVIQSKIFTTVAGLSLVLSILYKRNISLILFDTLLFYVFKNTIECMVLGGCKISSYAIMIVPITAIIINTFNITGISLTYDVDTLKLPNNIISQTSITNTDEEKSQQIKKITSVLTETT